MYITQEQNFGDSVLFLYALREALVGIVSESSVEKKKDLVNFIYNEASDYQILSLVVDGELPDEKFSTIGEMVLFSQLKEQLLYNYESVSKIVGEDLCDNFLNEVDSISPYQSTPALLEYAMMLNEFDPGAGPTPRIPGLDKAAKELAKKTGQSLAAAKKAVIAQSPKIKGELQASGEAGKQMVKTAMDFWKKKGGEAGAEVAKGAQAMGKGFAKAGGEVAGTVAGKAKEAAKGAKDWMTKKDLEIKRAVQPQGMRQAGERVAQAQQKGGFDAALRSGQPMTGGSKVDNIMQALKQKADSAKNMAMKVAQSPAGKAIGAAALAGLLIYGSYKIYKNMFSKAAKACKGMSGAAKKACMANHKAKAYAAQAQDLQAGSKACAKAKDPAKCQASVAKKVAKLKEKAAKAKSKAGV